MTHRIAIASSDGKNIDLHFAKASQFYIYDVNKDAFEFIELRKCEGIIKHDENEFDKKIEKFYGCMAVFVSQIGRGALAYVSSKGLRVFEAPYPIESVLEKLVQEDILNKAYESK
ncbi:MAG TPA: NifB/NifX family molybdenum-iron cluster-binding protein [Ruminiclostridium sp.]